MAVLIIALSTIFATLPQAKVHANPSTAIIVAPESMSNAVLNDDYVVTINVTDVSNLTCWQFELAYNSTVLSLVSDGVVPGGLPTPLIIWCQNNTAGNLYWAVSTMGLNQTQGISYADHAIFQIDFLAAALGTSNLHIYNDVLGNNAIPPTRIPHSTTDGSVIVCARAYSVSFSETSLPQGVQWSVTFNDQTQSSTSNSITFNAANGVYPFGVTPPAGYVASPSSGNIGVNGGSMTEQITFSPAKLLVYPENVVCYRNWPISFEGRVTDSNNNGLGNVLVSVTDPMKNGTCFVVVTDENGYFDYQTTASQIGNYVFTFTFGSTVAQTSVCVVSNNTDTDQLIDMWNYFKQQYMPTDSNGNIIGYAVYGGNDWSEVAGKVCTEGQGYAMLQAVWTNDKQAYDALRDWTDAHMWIDTAKTYLGWCAWPNGSLCNPSTGGHDPASAPDGDEDIALAAILAYYKWKDPNDYTFANELLNSFRYQDCITLGNGYYVSFGSSQFKVKNNNGQWAYVIDPSYMSPFSYRVFADFNSSDANYCNGLITSSYQVLDDIQSSVGLVPDYAEIWFDTAGIHVQALSDSVVISGGYDAPMYGYDAFRTMWRVALDYLYSSDSRAEAFLASPAEFFTNQLPPVNPTGFYGYYYFDSGNVTAGESNSPPPYTVYGGNIGAAFADQSGQLLNSILYMLRSCPYQAPTADLYEYCWVWFGLAMDQQVMEPSFQEVTMSVHSPVTFVVTDLVGRRAGVDPNTGQIIDEIPGCNVTVDPEETITIFNPVREVYNITLTGTANGTYRFDAILTVNSTSSTLLNETGEITNGTTQTLQVDASAPDIQVTNFEVNKPIVVEGSNLNVNVTVTNQGLRPETFNITVYGNWNVCTWPIYTFTNVTLAPGSTTTVTIGGLRLGVGFYTLSVRAYNPYFSNTYTGVTVRIFCVPPWVLELSLEGFWCWHGMRAVPN
jgi:endo-1,4-beta-D-glucanase Y